MEQIADAIKLLAVVISLGFLSVVIVLGAIVTRRK
jgi:hypothetical protein